jgi:hypothetical protein
MYRKSERNVFRQRFVIGAVNVGYTNDGSKSFRPRANIRTRLRYGLKIPAAGNEFALREESLRAQELSCGFSLDGLPVALEARQWLQRHIFPQIGTAHYFDHLQGYQTIHSEHRQSEL